MTVTLTNKTARTKVIVLDHQAFRTSEYGFARKQQTVLDQSKTGTVTERIVRRDEPGTLTLGPRASISGLHPAIENCAQVRTLKARGELAVTRDAVKGGAR